MQRSGCFSIDHVFRYFAGRLSYEDLNHVDLHLDSCARCRNLVDEVAKDSGRESDDSPRSLDDEIASLAAGTVIVGRYSIDRFIASGGMGEVYQATDRLVNEQVALKTVRSSLRGDPAALERLRRELRLARRVAHPNVCRVFDFVVDEGSDQSTGVAFLTMEFLAGETLRQVLRRDRRLSSARALGIWRDMLRGLEAAHAVGVIHRDLKPDNVMLVDGGEGQNRAVITDFGLARAVRADVGWHSGSGLVGTVGYIAPEQVLSRRVTASADVYSAGVVLHEMLTGQVPELAFSRPANDAAPSDPVSRSGPPDEDVDGRARRLAVSCLALNPDARPTVGQLLGELEAIRSQEGEPAFVHRRSRPVRRRLGLAAGASAGLGLLVIAAWTVGHSGGAKLWSPKTITTAGNISPLPPPPSPPPAQHVPLVHGEPQSLPVTAPVAVTTPVAAPAPVSSGKSRKPQTASRLRLARGDRLPVETGASESAPTTKPESGKGEDPRDIVRHLEEADLRVSRDILLNPFRE